MAPVHREGAHDPPIRCKDGRRPGRPQRGMLRSVAPKFPERVRLDVGDDDMAGQIHGGGAGTVADADRDVVHGRHELARQIRRDTDDQRLPFTIEQIDGALTLRHDALDQFANRFERRGQRDIGRDFLEHAALARGNRVRALALGDVGDAGADQAAVGTWQAHEPYLAGRGLPRGVAVRPFEYRRLTRQGAFDEAARTPEGRRAVGLLRRTDLVRAAGEQGLARHFEKTAGIVVDVDEFAPVDIEYHDHFGRMLHERAVARLALAHRLLGNMSFGDVADADDVAVAPIELRLADGDLDRDAIAALGPPPGLMRRQIHVGIVDLGREAFQKIALSARDVRQQEFERAAQDLRRRVAEDPLAGGIEGFDVAGVVQRDDGILDVVEDGLKVRGGLLPNLARERLRLVGHELHGAHDAAPLTIDPVVVRADGLEQRLEIQFAAPGSHFRDLALEQRVQSVRRRRRLATNCGSDIP